MSLELDARYTRKLEMLAAFGENPLFQWIVFVEYGHGMGSVCVNVQGCIVTVDTHSDGESIIWVEMGTQDTNCLETALNAEVLVQAIE